MSDLTAKVNKLDQNTLQVEGFEALKYNFHYTSNVFNTDDSTLADIYKRWGRVLIVMDQSELVDHASADLRADTQSFTRSTRTPSQSTLTTTTSRSPGRLSREERSTRRWT